MRFSEMAFIKLWRMGFGQDWHVIPLLSSTFSDMITLKVNQRLHSWRGDFGQKALDTINLLVEENRAVLDTKELVAEQMATYLQKVPIQPGSNLYTYAYQWLEWDTEMDK